jgi:diguanylate cyclase (GGDEF)-like protein
MHYYIASLIVLAFIVISFAFLFSGVINREYERKIEWIYGVLNSKNKAYLHETISNVISYIDAVRIDELRRMNAFCLEYAEKINISDLDKYKKDKIGGLYSQSDYLSALNYSFVDTKNNVTLHSSDSESSNKILEIILSNQEYENLSPVVSVLNFNDKMLFVYMSRKDVENIITNKIKKYIYSLKIGDAGYVWINKVLNFEGGDGYAVRLIHPNLPDTEGQSLSTQIEDINGGLPYQVELDGIKKNGELFFEYYFKKLNSEKIEKKLAYAKLYAPYNFIVATGIYLDDIESYVQKEKKHIDELKSAHLLNFIILAFVLLIVSLMILFIFERIIDGIFKTYDKKITDAEVMLRNDKARVDDDFESLSKIAYYDSLTEIVNRRAMNDIISREASRCLRKDCNFSVIIGDIDNFKQINDTYGHDFGDQVLQCIAQILKNGIRKEDVVSRWGGEEFLIIGIGGKVADGVAIAEGLRKKIELYKFDYNGVEIGVTMTFGVAEYGATRNIKDVIKEADSNLYIGKNNKKNCVIPSQFSTLTNGLC